MLSSLAFQTRRYLRKFNWSDFHRLQILSEHGLVGAAQVHAQRTDCVQEGSAENVPGSDARAVPKRAFQVGSSLEELTKGSFRLTRLVQPTNPKLLFDQQQRKNGR